MRHTPMLARITNPALVIKRFLDFGIGGGGENLETFYPYLGQRSDLPPLGT